LVLGGYRQDTTKNSLRRPLGKRGIMENYKVVMRFQATDEQDAENFVASMSEKDWLEHLEREE
jgi:hypothetical protein